MLRRAITLALLLALPLAADNKPKGVPLLKLAQQKAEIPNLVLPVAAQKCTNYAWAVAVETMLKLQNVALDQHYWVQKANGGELCIDLLPDLERLSRAVNGAYVLPDNRRVKLQTSVIGGAPTIPDDAIAPLKRGLPVLVFWKSRAYVLHQAVYDGYVYPNGQRMYQILKLNMVDPLAPAKEREVSFVNGTDDPAGISALVYVTAVEIPPTEWQNTTQWQNATQWQNTTKWK